VLLEQPVELRGESARIRRVEVADEGAVDDYAHRSGVGLAGGLATEDGDGRQVDRDLPWLTGQLDEGGLTVFILGDLHDATTREHEGSMLQGYSDSAAAHLTLLSSSQTGYRGQRSDVDVRMPHVSSAIILQPKCSVRDWLRWDSLGNRPLIFAENRHSSCDCL
jgi:hypothetical protein